MASNCQSWCLSVLDGPLKNQLLVDHQRSRGEKKTTIQRQGRPCWKYVELLKSPTCFVAYERSYRRLSHIKKLSNDPIIHKLSLKLHQFEVSIHVLITSYFNTFKKLAVC